MTFERDGASAVQGHGPGTGERTRLRPIAAGAVAGLGAFFSVRYLADTGGGTLVETVSELPLLLLSLSLVYAGFWLLQCDVPLERIGRVAACSLAGFLGLTAVVVWLVGSQGLPLQRLLLLTMDAGTVGASTGLLVGLEGERRDRSHGGEARHASRAAARAEERFAFLNRLLRHHLLNGVAVVRGHAELLDESLDEPPEQVRIIRQRSDELVGLVQNVETLGRVFTDDLPTRPTDPVGPLREAVAVVRQERAGADIRTQLGTTTAVVANERLTLAFEALLRYAVEHAEDDSVAVATAEAPGTVSVTIAFDAEGEPPGAAPIRVEQGGRTDLGLYLAESLVEYFGGAVEVAVGREDGIRVQLSAAT